METAGVQGQRGRFSVAYEHRLFFARNVWDPESALVAGLLEPDGDGPARALVVVDAGVASARAELPRSIVRYAEVHRSRMELACEPVVMPGGEAIKNDWREVEGIVRRIDACRLCRRSYVVVVGGGAVLDAVGLAASLAHRGVRLVRIASTTLAQADSAVGVKNGVNALGKKNLVGVFSVPWAVINDEALLDSLSGRDWRSGFAEAVKVALVRDAGLFERIEADAERIAAREVRASVPVLRRSAVLHLRHITEGGDAFERSHARPLDYGHWVAHRLEAMTGYTLRHGEAVAIGIALDALYAEAAGLLGAGRAERICACLERLGFSLHHPALGRTEEVLAGLEEFREHLGGRLTVTLLRDIGRPVDVHGMDASVVARAAGALAERAGVGSGA